MPRMLFASLLLPCFVHGFLFAGQALSPKEAEKAMKAPPGFSVTLCAGEPDLVQPAAIEIDDRGRLWVAEFKSYPKWKATGNDRILIFEDLDGKGHFGNSKVFWDKGNYLSGFTIGMGGVWVCCAPNLLFIPLDETGNKPAGEPQIILDGFGHMGQHNVINSLTWGPDGWLYGCDGITVSSLVGKPGAPEAERTFMHAGVWRYHPTKQIFEVVLSGTTNPWGIDYDDWGQMFITNTVIGHLWHVVQGMHTKRMFGDDTSKYSYDLLEQTGDHIHWAGGSWQSSRGGKGAHDATGGGHSHAGALIYTGDNWPDKYRNTFFTINTHGNRINNDILRRRGSGYVGLHGADILFANDELFRGVALKAGPDGGVFFCDWNQGGECHSGDMGGTGRVYKMVYGEPAPYKGDVSKLTDAQLIALQTHKNDWFVRRARLEMQEREAKEIASGKTKLPIRGLALLKHFDEATDVRLKLRYLWAMHAVGAATEETLVKLLKADDDNLRAWAVRLLVDYGPPSQTVLQKFAELATDDPSAMVRLYLASALQKIPPESRSVILANLASHAQDASDHNLPLMYWYALEPIIEKQPTRGPLIGLRSKIPILRQFSARRATEQSPGAGLDVIQFALEDAEKPGATEKTSPLEYQFRQVDALNGMLTALKGRRDVKPPFAWKKVSEKLNASKNAEVKRLGVKLAVVFGDTSALETYRTIAADAKASIQEREQAIDVLVTARDAKAPEVLQALLSDAATRGTAIRGLAVFDDAKTAAAILDAYPNLTLAEKSDAFYALGSRQNYARALLDALKEKRVPKEDMNAFTLRYLENANVPELNLWIKENWGGVKQTSEEKLERIAKYKKLVQSAGPQATDVKRGYEVFKKTCVNCHTLFGEGGKVGPDLTGSGRANLDYLLTNIVDPNALVQYDYQITVLRMKDGRMISGLKRNDRDKTFDMITANEMLTVGKNEVATEKRIDTSMMPEGILDTLSDQQLLDLIAFLQSDGKR